MHGGRGRLRTQALHCPESKKASALPHVVLTAGSRAFHILGGGTGLPAQSARPRNHPQAVPEIVPQATFHNDRTEPIPYGTGSWPGARTRTPQGSRACRWPPGQKRPAGWSPFTGIARIRSLGSPFSLLLSGLSAFPSPLRLPGGWCGPAPSITSQMMVRLPGAGDGRPGPKAPARTGRTSWLRRTAHSPVSGRRKSAAAISGLSRIDRFPGSHAGCFPALLRAGRSIGPRSPAVRHISIPGLDHRRDHRSDAPRAPTRMLPRR